MLSEERTLLRNGGDWFCKRDWSGDAKKLREFFQNECLDDIGPQNSLILEELFDSVYGFRSSTLITMIETLIFDVYCIGLQPYQIIQGLTQTPAIQDVYMSEIVRVLESFRGMNITPYRKSIFSSKIPDGAICLNDEFILTRERNGMSVNTFLLYFKGVTKIDRIDKRDVRLIKTILAEWSGIDTTYQNDAYSAIVENVRETILCKRQYTDF